jgi:hypothetical protein
MEWLNDVLLGVITVVVLGMAFVRVNRDDE